MFWDRLSGRRWEAARPALKLGRGVLSFFGLKGNLLAVDGPHVFIETKTKN